MTVDIPIAEYTPVGPAELAREYGAEDMRLTPNGINMFAEDPASIEAFLLGAARLVPDKHPGYTFIKSGSYGNVYELPGFSNLCLKVASQRTLCDEDLSIPDLTIETGFMNAIQQRLASRTEYAVRAPKQYAVASFAGGMAMLQERIPTDFTSIQSLINHEADTDKCKILVGHKKSIAKRVKQAIGFSTLQLGVGDLRDGVGRVNGSNILVDDHTDPLQGNVYVIDLIGHRKRRAIVATTLAGLKP